MPRPASGEELPSVDLVRFCNSSSLEKMGRCDSQRPGVPEGSQSPAFDVFLSATGSVVATRTKGLARVMFYDTSEGGGSTSLGPVSLR